MRSQVTVPALMSGEVNYTLSFGNIVGGAMQGMPFKILAVLTDKPLHSLVAKPEIKTINDLRGKRIGTQRIGGSDQLAAEAILQAKGHRSQGRSVRDLGRRRAGARRDS